jgi:ferritin-like metal-binding protein YciE
MQTGHELFVHGLNDMMDAERQLIGPSKSLPVTLHAQT